MALTITVNLKQLYVTLKVSHSPGYKCVFELPVQVLFAKVRLLDNMLAYTASVLTS